MTDFIIDIQAFKNNNNGLLIKECAVLTTTGEEIHHWIILPPFDYYELTKNKRKKNKWLTLNHHEIDCNDGSISYQLFLRQLKLCFLKAKNIFVKDKEKTVLLNSISKREVLNLEDIGVSSLKTMRTTPGYPLLQCQRHSMQEGYICALENACKLLHWLS